MKVFDAGSMFNMATTIFEKKFDKSFKRTCKTIQREAKRGRFLVHLDVEDVTIEEILRTKEELIKLNFQCDYKPYRREIVVYWGDKKF